jgi:hypothetical protein
MDFGAVGNTSDLKWNVVRLETCSVFGVGQHTYMQGRLNSESPYRSSLTDPVNSQLSKPKLGCRHLERSRVA